ncbi:response regulator transcription factor [Flavobacterium antarcticum]|uniref:response regulator transcription factor n=1 Tax=Flavobacterium antarcticum TaxID=271155 RepID=UPI0003B67B16|nr:response regulator transcription factor [Flavobacterium antarcticum]
MNSPKKILIIEDDELKLKILQFILKKEQYEFQIATDGATGIVQITQYKPDLVITDIMLPINSGLEIVTLLKNDFPQIPVIVLSALGDEEQTIIEAFELGADDFIAKPFNPIELILRVKRLIDK